MIKKKGFTIVELIVVMAVVGILVLLAMPKFMGYTEKAKLTKVRNDIKVIENSAELYYMDNNEWPRLNDAILTAAELETYAKEFYDSTGANVTLDPAGRYYLVNYDELSSYMQTSNIKGLYLLQNPVGNIYYVSKFTDEGKEKFEESSEDILAKTTITKDIAPPTINNTIITDKAITIEATDNKDGEIEYLIKTDNGKPSKNDEWQKGNIVTVPDFGTYYVFVRDKSGNISEPIEVKVTDDAKPVINNANVTDKTITIDATDNGVISSYAISSVDSNVDLIWVDSNIITAPTYGTYYVFTKDNVGNISDSYKVIVADNEVPVINDATVNDKEITVLATDNDTSLVYGISTTNNKEDVKTYQGSNVFTVPNYGVYFVFAKDTFGNISDGKEVKVMDNVLPVIDSVNIKEQEITIIATDNIGVTGYGVSITDDSSDVSIWLTSNVITVPDYGTYYIFTKDAQGNISEAKLVTTVDGIKPTISSVTSNDKVITITASDNIGVTGYGISTTNNSNGVSTWSANNTITAPGYGTYYIFVKDAKNNISDSQLVTTTDAIKPIISNATVSDKAITIIATDNVEVTSYGISTTNNSNGVSNWTTSNIVTAPDYGTYYVFAKDVKGNVSDGKSITTIDRIKPVISNVAASDKTITITASDNIGVTSYGISTTNSSSGVSIWGTSNVTTAPNYGTYYLFVKDAQGNISDGKSVTTKDAVKPIISNAITSDKVITITASDNIGVTNYGISTTNSSSGVISWGTSNAITAPGYGTYYAFVKDAAGNISDGKAVATADAIKPTISNVTASDKVITITASDNIAVTNYGYNTSNSTAGITWGTSNAITVPTYGTYYVFAKDAVGNISDSKSVSTIDKIKPTISNATSSDKTIKITASDNIGITNYGYSTSNSSSGATWQAGNKITVSGYGRYYVFARDAQGNISDSKEITTTDEIRPTVFNVMAFDKTINIAASDNVGVTGYAISKSSNANLITNWYLSGEITAEEYGVYYAFAKDAQGNISLSKSITIVNPAIPVIQAVTNNSSLRTITIIATDNKGVTSYGYATTNDVTKVNNWNSSNSLTYPSNTRGVYVFVKDADGNISTSKFANLEEFGVPGGPGDSMS